MQRPINCVLPRLKLKKYRPINCEIPRLDWVKCTGEDIFFNNKPFKYELQRCELLCKFHNSICKTFLFWAASFPTCYLNLVGWLGFMFLVNTALLLNPNSHFFCFVKSIILCYLSLQLNFTLSELFTSINHKTYHIDC